MNPQMYSSSVKARGPKACRVNAIFFFLIDLQKKVKFGKFRGIA